MPNPCGGVPGKTHGFRFHCDWPTGERLKDVAAALGFSCSVVIRNAVIAYLDAYERENGPVPARPPLTMLGLRVEAPTPRPGVLPEEIVLSPVVPVVYSPVCLPVPGTR